MKHAHRAGIFVTLGVVIATTIPGAVAGAGTQPVASAVQRLASTVGITVLDPVWDPDVLEVPEEIVVEVSGLLDATARCTKITTRFLPRTPVSAPKLLAGSVGDVEELSYSLEECVEPLEETIARVRTAVESLNGRSVALVEMWPFLRLDLSQRDNVHEHDYLVSIDAGGNDTYLNNSGGNLVDVRRGPAGSSSLQPGPARGCRNVGDIGNVAALRLRTDPECVPLAAVLLDLGGDDTYGSLEKPDPQSDGFCTADPVVPRIMTEGVGFAGIGVLVDRAGDDVYLGKTGTQGAGHVGGVGILRDEAGDDTYLAIRNAQGLGLVYGSGSLIDDSGDDSYGFYMPGALDPKAEFQERASGGVIDDTGRCDNLPRQLQGTGQLGGIGQLLDLSGDDVYVGSLPSTQQFLPNMILAHGSQAFGSAGGIGVLYDGAGRDAYLTGTATQMPHRGDGLVQGPSWSNDGALNSAFFADRDECGLALINMPVRSDMICQDGI